jgi:hypothetical protein
MNTSTRFLIKTLLVVLALVLTTSATRAQDIAKVAPNNCKVLLENDRARGGNEIAGKDAREEVTHKK